MSDRYTTGQQGEFQPGSGDTILANQLGITNTQRMNAIELDLLEQLYHELFLGNFPDRQLTLTDFRTWHRRWLSPIYLWAGQERAVNMSKGGFQFAAAAQVPRLLTIFEHDYLSRWTPCRLTGDALTHALAVTHVELILIHPFREGNGRLSRLLADVMAVQAGARLLDYSSWEKNKTTYIQAIHAGLANNYVPMQALMKKALETPTLHQI